MDKERIGNAFNIDLKEGKVCLVYGNHADRQRFPNEMKSIVQDSDALVLEFISRLENPRNYLNSPADALLDILDGEQYRGIFLDRKKSGKPMYILDANFEFEDEQKYNDFLRVAEPLLGSTLFASLSVAEAIKILKKRKAAGPHVETTENVKSASRRNILKGLAGLGMAWALTQPVATHAQNITYKNDSGQGAAAELQKFSQAVHPELDQRVVRYRNLLMAYKLIKLLQHEQVHDVSMVVGLAHVGVEEILIDYQDGKISLKDMEEVLKQINSAVNSPVFHTVGKYYWDEKNDKWEISSFDIDELK